MTNPLPRIDPEFMALIPPLQEEEYRQLEQNILAYKKCRDAIVVWDGTIVDGHNRFRICATHGVPFEIKEVEFESRDEAKLWILDNQLGRRNLTNAMRIELAMGRVRLLRERARERQADGGRFKSSGQAQSQSCDCVSLGITANNGSGPHSACVCGMDEKLLMKSSKSCEGPPVNVRKTVANDAGVSEWAVQIYTQIEEHGSPKLLEAVKSGALKIGTAHRLLDTEITKQLKHADKLYRFIEKNLYKIEDPPARQEIREGLAHLQGLLGVLLEGMGGEV